METTESLSVWVLDPANLTPFYCAALGSALAGQGDRTRLITSRFLHDPDFRFPDSFAVDYDYFRRLRWLQERGPKWLRRLWRGLSYPLGHWRLLQRARRERPDIVHIQWSRVPIVDLVLIRELKRLGIPVVHTVHDVEPLYGGAGGASQLERVYRESDALIVHSDANRAELLERYPSVRGERISVIPHGPLQAELCPAGATMADARRELGLPEEAAVALFFGTIKPYKGLDLLLDAFARVAPEVPGACLVIGGNPANQADVPDLAPLKEIGVPFRADFGFIPNDQVWRYYLAADVVVLPYRNITQSGVLLASMAFGKASIVSAVGGLPEVVLASGSGWVVPPEDRVALASALRAALGDRAATRAMGERARRFVQEEFSWERIGRATHELYRKLTRTVSHAEK